MPKFASRQIKGTSTARKNTAPHQFIHLLASSQLLYFNQISKMVAFSTKTIVTATLAMGLSAPALACVEFSGSINTDTFGGDLKSVENGVQTCSGSIQTGNKNVGKSSDYHVSKTLLWGSYLS